MPKKKVITKKTIKKIIKKKAVLKKKTKSSNITKKSSVKPNPLELIFKENEVKLISLISKEFDKELASKAKTYIKSYSKIEDSIITVNDFLNYVENLDEDLFKLFKAYTSSTDSDSSSSSDNQKKRRSQQVLRVMIQSECISKKWVMLNYFQEGEIAIAKELSLDWIE